ncbi:MAG: Kelch repeat-containing protein [Candidatus Hodarchaeota archaeon]
MLLLLCLVLPCLSFSLVNAIENSWTTMEPMPNLKSVYGVAEANEKIYVFVHDATYEYDPETDTWTTKYPMPILRGSFGMATYGNKIYLIGGNILGSYSGWNITGLNQVYDPETDTWETRTPMPTPRMRLDANVASGKIYLIGGFDHTWPYHSLDENEVYDPETDTWAKKTSLLNPSEDYSSAVVDDKIYVIGGRDYSEILSLTQIYDPETDTWSYGAPMAANTAAAGATTGVLAPKRIYVIGGMQNLDSINRVRVYDPEADVWTTGASMPTPRYYLGVAVVNDLIYAIGGVLSYPAYITAVNERYTPIGYIPEFPSWIVLPLFLATTLFVIVFRKRLFCKSS